MSSIEIDLNAEPGPSNAETGSTNPEPGPSNVLVIDVYAKIPPKSEAMEDGNNDDAESEPSNAKADSSDSDTDEDYHDHDDDEVDFDLEEPTTCLFCPHISSSIDPAIAHLLTEHNVDLAKLKTKHNMDDYSFIMLINCIRTENTKPEDLLNADINFWSHEKYMKPVVYEPWLTYDYNQLYDEDAVANENQFRDELLEMLQEKSIQLDQATKDIKIIQNGFERALDALDTQTRNHLCIDDDDEGCNSAYFKSYSHFGIHHEMLSDVVRTTSYRDALFKNKNFINGKTVLDVGCGTAVLSIFASKAGASEVVAVENSDIIQKAMGIVKNNKIENITLVRGLLEDVELPIEKFDIIISEWMGYFLIFEGMLDSIIYARKKLLKDGGIILPSRCQLSLVGYGNDDLFSQYVQFWDNVYDIDMSLMRNEVISEPLVEVVDPQYILTKPETLTDLNMATVELNYAKIKHKFEMTFEKDGNFSAFVGYFNTHFDLPSPVMFGTAPTDEPTHWKQVVFFINQPVAVKAGQSISVKFKCKRMVKYARSLEVSIEVLNTQYRYHLD